MTERENRLKRTTVKVYGDPTRQNGSSLSTSKSKRKRRKQRAARVSRKRNRG